MTHRSAHSSSYRREVEQALVHAGEPSLLSEREIADVEAGYHNGSRVDLLVRLMLMERRNPGFTEELRAAAKPLSRRGETP